MPETSRIRQPSLLFRARTFIYHGARILFLKWPGYTFDDLAAIQDSLDGKAFQNVARRMRADENGAQVMASRPEIGVMNGTPDWSRLSALPVDTLGYNLWHHLYTYGILKDLVLGEPIVRWDADTEYAKKRYRETHDIRHVLLGLGLDGYEEVVLQSFQFAQQPQILSAGIVLLGGLKHLIIDRNWRELWHGVPAAWREGKKATFLSNVYYEQLWETPLEELRAQLNIRPVQDLYPVKERHPDAPWSPPLAREQKEHRA